MAKSLIVVVNNGEPISLRPQRCGPRRRRPQTRRGAVAIMLLASIIVMLGCVGLALDLAMISFQTAQTQTGCDAAALAAAAEVMDDRTLTPEGLAQWLWAAETGSSPPALDRNQRVAARQQAQYFAAQNASGGRPLMIDLNSTNQPAGDVVLGWVHEPRRIGSPFVVGDDRDAINSVLVRAARTRERGNPITMLFSRVLGLQGFDLVGVARATLDQRVYGFRPVNHVRVPLLPMVVGGPAELPNEWLVQATSAAVPSENDRIAVDNRTGLATPGADGIPEIQLRVTADEAGRPIGNVQPVSFYSSTSFQPNLWQRQCALGLDAVQLAARGGQIAADENGLLQISRVASLHSTSLSTIRRSLLAIRGQKRIWMLAQWTGEAECQIINFAAARILKCEIDRESALRIVLQPCLLQTSTALVREDSPHNPWLGRVTLTK